MTVMSGAVVGMTTVMLLRRFVITAEIHGALFTHAALFLAATFITHFAFACLATAIIHVITAAAFTILTAIHFHVLALTTTIHHLIAVHHVMFMSRFTGAIYL